jgi:hypothetical protein
VGKERGKCGDGDDHRATTSKKSRPDKHRREEKVGRDNRERQLSKEAHAINHRWQFQEALLRRGTRNRQLKKGDHVALGEREKRHEGDNRRATTSKKNVGTTLQASTRGKGRLRRRSRATKNDAKTLTLHVPPKTRLVYYIPPPSNTIFCLIVAFFPRLAAA